MADREIPMPKHFFVLLLFQTHMDGIHRNPPCLPFCSQSIIFSAAATRPAWGGGGKPALWVTSMISLLLLISIKFLLWAKLEFFTLPCQWRIQVGIETRIWEYHFLISWYLACWLWLLMTITGFFYKEHCGACKQHCQWTVTMKKSLTAAWAAP
jgi:hypothetical protein